MTVVSVKIPANSGLSIRRITLSDGAKFSYSTAYLPPRTAEPEPGREISPEAAGIFRHAAACYLVERAALKLVARAEQCRSGLARKLRRNGADPALVDEALDCLERQELLSDRRYAELWLRVKLRPALGGRRSTMSPRKLSQGLVRRGIAPRVAREALGAALGPENERALLESYILALSGAGSSRPRGEGGNLGLDDSTRRRLRGEGFSAGLIRALEEGE